LRKFVEFSVTLFIVFTLLKLTGAEITWLWVFSPIWIPLVLGLFSVLAIVILLFLIFLSAKIGAKESQETGIYLVTTEVKENLIKRFLRHLGLNKRGNFRLQLENDFFKVGEILDSGGGNKIKIIKKL